MAANIYGVFRENLQNAILKSKVLVVGAGGIGCEILKNLVMTGFSDIEIVSLSIFIAQNLSYHNPTFSSRSFAKIVYFSLETIFKFCSLRFELFLTIFIPFTD